MDFEFYVDIEDAAGNKLGGGPLSSVGRWRYTARMDRAGAISFDCAATDPQASVVTNRRIARAWARLNGVWTEVGAGRIDALSSSPGPDGQVTLSASGLDLTVELGDRNVGTLAIGTGSGATHAAALSAVGALAPAGWTFTPAASPANNYIHAQFGGESVLGALVYIADRTRTHFYRSNNRTLVFASSYSSSGVRAVQATGDLAPETCAITALTRSIDSHDLLTRITPFGSGQGAARLTLSATTRTAPAGYTFNRANNFIQATAAVAAYGVVNHPQIEFKEIGPISGTAADIQAASNMLFDAALWELQRRSTLVDQVTYTLSLAGCSTLLRPLQTLRVVYRDIDQGISIDETLTILEATWEVDASGVRTTQVVVSNQVRWPEDEAALGAERAVTGRVYMAHPQLNANSYVLPYTKHLDDTLTATMRFRFGLEVVQLQQVRLDFQILPFESTVKSVGADTVTSGSGGGTTATSTSGLGSNYTTPSGGGTTSGSGSSHSHTVTIGTHSHNVDVPGHSHTVTVSAHTHNVPNHGHSIPITGAAVSNTVGFGAAGTAGGLVSGAVGGGTTFQLPSNAATGAVTSDSGGGSTPTSSTTTIGVLSSGAGGSSTPTSSADTSHTHTVGNHTHTFALPHTHDVTIGNHTHNVTPTINTVYGIYRETAGNTYALADLEYRVNSGVWAGLDTATDAGGGWYYLDLTGALWNATTFTPTQANNTVEIRRATGAPAGKTAAIDAQLTVRNIIQATAYGLS